MGQGSSKRGKKTRVTKPIFQKSEDSKEAKVVVGAQMSSNLIESIFQQKIEEIASQQAEQFAEALLLDEDTLSSSNETQVGGDQEHLSSFLFASTEAREELLALLSETSDEFSSVGKSVPRWKVHANAAKFERHLNEKYGRLRPFITKHPEIETYLRNLQRRYNKGEFSAFRQGPPPIDKKASIILLVIMHRNGARIETVFLTALFFLIGLQPWALILLVSVGRFFFHRRKKKKIDGWFGDEVKTVKSYYAHAVNSVPKSDKEKIKQAKYDALSEAVGTPITLQDFDGEKGDVSEVYDTMIIGSGPSTLYTAALLARTGRSVLVLSPEMDASGCRTTDARDKNNLHEEKLASIPVDVDCNNIAHTSVQQQILVPALCTDTDLQGGVRFAQIGTEDDGFTSDILSIPGMGVDNYKDAIPFLIRAGGVSTIANDAAALLGDAWPNEDGFGDSTSAAYLSLCADINATAKDCFITKLLPDKICEMKKASTYQEASIRYASGFLDKGLPYNPHVRSLMAGIGMRGENIPPSKTSMAAQVTNLCACLSPDGFSYPIGGPRSLCHAMTAVIEQNGGKVVTNVGVKEYLFEDFNESEGDGSNDNESDKPRCIGVKLNDDRKITIGLNEDGCIISMLGFIDTFIFKMPNEVRTKYGIPVGLPALSERRPLLKLIFSLDGDSTDLSLTGADWYRLPNASLPIDEKDTETGQVIQGHIGIDHDEEKSDGVESLQNDDVASSIGRGKRMKNVSGSKKKTRRVEFFPGRSWMKVSFPSAKDPSWNDRYNGISTCVVTIEAGCDFVRTFETLPKVFSAIKCGSAEVNCLAEKVTKDLLQTFPQLEGKILSCKMDNLVRAGLSHDPQRFAVKGIRPKTPYPGLFIGGSDLTIGDSFSASTVGGWLVANAVLGYSFVDYLFLDKNITNDISQFLRFSARNNEEDLAVPLDNNVESEF